MKAMTAKRRNMYTKSLWSGWAVSSGEVAHPDSVYFNPYQPIPSALQPNFTSLSFSALLVV